MGRASELLRHPLGYQHVWVHHSTPLPKPTQSDASLDAVLSACTDFGDDTQSQVLPSDTLELSARQKCLQYIIQTFDMSIVVIIRAILSQILNITSRHPQEYNTEIICRKHTNRIFEFQSARWHLKIQNVRIYNPSGVTG